MLQQTTFSDLAPTYGSGNNIDSTMNSYPLSISTIIQQSANISLTILSSYTSDASYWVDNIYGYHLTKKNSVTANLTCLASGSTQITYSYSTIFGNVVPSWGSIDSTNNILVFTPPSVTVDTTYTFTLSTYVASNKNTYYQSVYIQVDACLVSNCYICVSGNTNKCSQCNTGYEVYFRDYSCVVSTVTTAAQASTVSSIVFSSVGATSVAVTSLLSLTSPQGIWISINQFQLLLLLLLSGAYFPSSIVYYLAGMDFTMFSFNFIPTINAPVVSYLKDWLSFDCNNSYLTDIGLNSGSTLLNNLSLFMAVFIQMCFHCVFILVFYKVIVKYYQKYHKLASLKQYLHKFYTLSVYIRTILEANQFLLICSAYEINQIGNKTISRSISLAIAFFIFIFEIKLFVVVGFLTFKNIQNKLNKKWMYVFSEIFDGIKETNLAKCYNFVNVLRRTFLVCLFIFGESISLLSKIIVLICFQAFLCAYKIVARPIKETKDCFLEILNEILFFSLSCILLRYNSVSNWNSSAEYGFIGSITAVSFISFVVYFIAFIRTIISKIADCKKRKISNYSVKEENNAKDVKEEKSKISMSESEHKSNSSMSQLHNNKFLNNNGPRLVVIDFANEQTPNSKIQEIQDDNHILKLGSLNREEGKEWQTPKRNVEESKTHSKFFGPSEITMRSSKIFKRNLTSLSQ